MTKASFALQFRSKSSNESIRLSVDSRENEPCPHSKVNVMGMKGYGRVPRSRATQCCIVRWHRAVRRDHFARRDGSVWTSAGRARTRSGRADLTSHRVNKAATRQRLTCVRGVRADILVRT